LSRHCLDSIHCLSVRLWRHRVRVIGKGGYPAFWRLGGRAQSRSFLGLVMEI